MSFKKKGLVHFFSGFPIPYQEVPRCLGHISDVGVVFFSFGGLSNHMCIVLLSIELKRVLFVSFNTNDAICSNSLYIFMISSISGDCPSSLQDNSNAMDVSSANAFVRGRQFS